MSYQRLALRKGLTLLELVVVMVILVALAGILVPLLPGMLGKAHTSTGATNITELDKLFETCFAAGLKYPESYDSLCDSDGLYTKLPGYVTEGTAAGAQISYGALTEAESAALYNAGIRTLWGMKDDTPPITNATFDPYDTANDIEIAQDGTPSVALANEARVEELFGPKTGTQKYVIVGVGAHSSAVGREGLMRDPPLHFGDEAGSSPDQVYQRFAVIFDVTGEAARFVGSVAIHGGQLDSGRGPMEAYWGKN